MDRLGDAKDQVRDQDQALLLKIMDQAANPQVHNSTRVHSNLFVSRVTFIPQVLK